MQNYNQNLFDSETLNTIYRKRVIEYSSVCEDLEKSFGTFCSISCPVGNA